MNVHALIFSNKQSFRLGRHALFWFLWILYYAFMSALFSYERYGFGKSFLASFVEVAESTPLDMCFCYFVIYFLFPKFLFKGRYVAMLLLWLLASIGFIFLYELNAIFVVMHIQDWFGMSRPSGKERNYTYDFFILFSQINMEGCVAASIKLGKLWYIKQQEINLIKKEKEKLLPEDGQGLIQPAFLTNLLTRIENIANEKPILAAKSIQKIRHLLLYILYENKSSKVSLQKEFELLQEYIDLEKFTSNKEISINTYINASPSAETIAPFIILPVIENAFRQLSNYSIKNPVLNLSILLQNGIIEIKLNWDKPVETSSLTGNQNVVLNNISKRLQLIYPQSHELKMMIETERVFIDLKINLNKAIN